MRYYHFVGSTLRDGSPIPEDGVWLEHSGRIAICKSGLHASEHVSDALQFAPGNTLCLVELEDIADRQSDKVVAARRKIIARFDATELLRAHARACALSVIHLWKAPDVVKRYLETGDESLRQEAHDAARSAAARYAHYAYAAAADAYAAAAARYAHYAYAAAAARSAADADADARNRLQAAVDAKFAELGVK